ncbi:MAG TPA: universal stress protein [Bacteroidota bacterium]|nr:universal stress protein [Bacteroidota bacterium]
MKEKKQSPASKSKALIRRILVPVDFSEHSKDALQYAVDLGSVFDAELILVFVVESAGYPADLGYGQAAIPAMERDLSERGKAELARIAEQYIGGKLAVKFHVPAGRPFVEIIRAAREFEADMIIIATHGHTGVEHILFGSTAEKVVRKAPCPVLVVR